MLQGVGTRPRAAPGRLALQSAALNWKQSVDASSEKRWVAATSVAAAVALTGMKLGVGLWTNSLGLLSEAAHSGLDLLAALMTLWAVHISSRPADADHTYGHGKYENLSALAQSVLLVITCGWIIYEALARLVFRGQPEVTPNIWAFGVVLVSIAVDFSRARALKRAADKHHSQALEADALHFSTDIWSSLVVLLGLLCVLAAEKLALPWLAHADSLAALAVCAIVMAICWKLGKKAIDDLLDRVPAEWSAQVASAASRVPGVEQVTQLRMRRTGPEIFVDVTLAIDRGTAFERAHQIADEAETAIRGLLPSADVTVHLEPVVLEEEEMTAAVRAIAGRHGLGVHAVQVYQQGDRRWIELHLEVEQSLTLQQAHQQATAFEQDVHAAFPEVEHIVSHLEPAGASPCSIAGEPVGQLQVYKALGEFVANSSMQLGTHDVRVQSTGDELAVSLHCTLRSDTSITAAHQLSEQLERYLRQRVPGIGRVAIHVEPEHG